MLRQAPGDQICQPQMHLTPGKGIDKKMPAFTGFQDLGQQCLRGWQGRALLLQLQQGPHALQFGR